MGAGSFSATFKLVAAGAVFCAAIPQAKAACGERGPLDDLSQEAWKVVLQQEIKKAEASANIDNETAQILLGRVFDLETGKPLVLSERRKAQYSSEAKLFAQYLRSEAAKARAKSEAVFDRLQPCDGAEAVKP